MMQPTLLRLAVVTVVVAALTSCQLETRDRILTVEEVIPRIDELNGETVSVSGYLSDCMGYDCRLFEDKRDSDQHDREVLAMYAAAHRNERANVPNVPLITVGSGPSGEFDAKAAPFNHSYVVITGTITNICRYDGQPSCTDRGPDLLPRDIRASSPAER